jgi:hypothetical protein
VERNTRAKFFGETLHFRKLKDVCQARAVHCTLQSMVSSQAKQQLLPLRYMHVNISVYRMPLTAQ